MVLSGAMYPNYFSLVPSDEAEALRMLSGRDPCTTVMVRTKFNLMKRIGYVIIALKSTL